MFRDVQKGEAPDEVGTWIFADPRSATGSARCAVAPVHLAQHVAHAHGNEELRSSEGHAGMILRGPCRDGEFTPRAPLRCLAVSNSSSK